MLVGLGAKEAIFAELGCPRCDVDCQPPKFAAYDDPFVTRGDDLAGSCGGQRDVGLVMRASEQASALAAGRCLVGVCSSTARFWRSCM